MALNIFCSMALGKDLINVDIHYYEKVRSFNFSEDTSEKIMITENFDDNLNRYITAKTEFQRLIKIIKSSKEEKKPLSCHRNYIRINKNKLVCLDSKDGKKIDNKIRDIIITSSKPKK